MPTVQSAIQQPIKKDLSGKKLPILVALVVLFLLVALGFSTNIKNLKEREAVPTKTESPQLQKISEIITLFENPSQELLDQIDATVWKIKKESILGTEGSGKRDLYSLEDVRRAIRDEQFELAKEMMRSGLFDRLTVPLSTKDKGTEAHRILTADIINKSDPQRVFFDKDAVGGRVAEARYEIAIKFLELYYSL